MRAARTTQQLAYVYHHTSCETSHFKEVLGLADEPCFNCPLFFCLFIAGCFVHKASFCYRISGFQERQWNPKKQLLLKKTVPSLSFFFFLVLMFSLFGSFYCICVVGISSHNTDYFFFLSLLEIFSRMHFLSHVWCTCIFILFFFMNKLCTEIQSAYRGCMTKTPDVKSWYIIMYKHSC